MMAYNLTLPLISGFLCILLLTLTQFGMVLLKPIAWDGGWGGGFILGYKVPARFYVLSFPG